MSAGCHGERVRVGGYHGGRLEDLVLVILHNLLFFATFSVFFLLLWGQNATMDAEAELDEVEDTGSTLLAKTNTIERQEWLTRETTYIMMMVIAKSAFACLQYGMLAESFATLQFFAMYHGAPDWGCFGSDSSLPPW